MKTTKIFGPPGTGKTTELLRIMEKELEAGVPPNRVAYLTFSRDASQVAVDRAKEQFDYTRDDLPWFRTFHSVAYELLEVSRAQMIADPDELAPFRREAVPFAGWGDEIDIETEGTEQADQLLRMDSYRRHVMKSMEDVVREWPLRTWGSEADGRVEVAREARWFGKQYRKWREREGLLDFTDLLERVDRPLPVDVVIVDEAQDLSALQWQALEQYAADSERVYLAGDDDQAVYTWAGADPRALVEWDADVVRTLDQSYRVPARVHRLAAEIIEGVEGRQEKHWRPRGERGTLRSVRGSSLGDVRHLLPGIFRKEGSWLVLYRKRSQGRAVARELRKLGVPYAGVDRERPGGEYAKEIVQWERLRRGQDVGYDSMQDLAAATGDSNLVDQVEGATAGDRFTMNSLRERYGWTDDRPWYEALRKIPAREVHYIRRVLKAGHGKASSLLNEPRIRLSTMHRAKGDEADHVFLWAALDGRPLKTWDVDPGVEARVFYVGVTRARKSLTIFGADTSPMFRQVNWTRVNRRTA